jgi:hypothetical protein
MQLSLCYPICCKQYSPIGPRPPPCRGFEITLRHTTLGVKPLNKWSVHRRRPYLTTLKRDIHPCPPVVFEPAVLASEQPQAILDRAATQHCTPPQVMFSTCRKIICCERRVGLQYFRNPMVCLVLLYGSYTTALCNGRRAHWPNHLGRWTSGCLSLVCAQVHWMLCHCVF